MQKNNTPYEPPKVEVITFELKETIASSLDHGPNLSCSEEIFGIGNEST